MWEELEILKKKYLEMGLSEAIDYEKFSMISIVYKRSIVIDSVIT
jgi:hypothetical protein